MRINATLLRPVSDWACEKRELFTPNGVGRRYAFLDRAVLAAPPEVWEIKQDIVDAYDLHGADQEPTSKDFCGLIVDGGAIHAHKDFDFNGKAHVRFNVMVSKPEFGGMPVQNGVELVVNEGDVWRCDASRVEHCCTPVQGSKPRIILSYGFLI